MATPLRFKLGKTAPKPIKLSLRDYLSLSTIPLPPVSGGHKDLITEHNMFGNDTVGDCTCADLGHATIYWNKEAGKDIDITTDSVLEVYSAVSGYNGSPETDNGANMADVASYHQKTGIRGVNGSYHKIAAYMAVTPGNIEELQQSIYLFGACSIGWELPDTAQEQFQAGEPWFVVSGATIEGGHDTLAVGYDPDYLYIDTWGQVHPVEWSFVSKYMDEGIVKLSEEMLQNGQSLEGFNALQLQEDIKSL